MVEEISGIRSELRQVMKLGPRPSLKRLSSPVPARNDGRPMH